MPIVETLTDEQFATIWQTTGQATASIASLASQAAATEDTDEVERQAAQLVQETNKPEPATVEPPKPDKPAPQNFTSKELDDAIANAYNPNKEEDDEDETPQAQTQNPASPAKPGRKSSDLVSTINQLVAEELIFGYEDGDVKTIEEAKELIKSNLKEREKVSFDKVWEEKIKTYSPQVQAILHYAEQGGSDVTPLLSAISKIESTAELTLDTAEGQEAIVREMLHSKGFDADEIKDQIETFKDLDKLKAKAEKFLPELNKVKEREFQRILKEQEDQKAQALEASRVYLQTIQNTLSKDTIKDVKLKREDKAKIFEALAYPKYNSLGGGQTNGFVKALEDLQFGQKSDYEHFLNIVRYTVDPEGFVKDIRESVKTEVTAEQVKRLRTAKTSSANTEDTIQGNGPARKTIQRSEFKNPFV